MTMYEALWHDLRRNKVDADLMDVGYNIREADYALAHLDEWMKPVHKHTPVLTEPGHVRVRRDPFGVTLIIGAWNEPYMLRLAPLVAAIAAGNTAVVKPSEISEAVSAQTAEMIPKYLDSCGGGRSWRRDPGDDRVACAEVGPDLLGPVHQFRAHLHRTGSCPGLARGQGRARGRDQGGDPRLLREDPKQSLDYGRVINRRNFDRLVAFLGERNDRRRRGDRSGRALHRPDRARRRLCRLADHAKTRCSARSCRCSRLARWKQ